MAQRALPASTRIQLFCAMGGPATIVVALVGWLLAGLLPLPLGPHHTQEQVVAFYRDHQLRLVAGFVLAGIGVGGVFPLIAAISVQMLRMEGRYPILTFMQLVTGAATGVMLLVPMLLMTVIGYRPDRSPELTLMLNDMAWMLFITPIMPFILQNVAIGVAVLNDENGIFPRWAGYLNLIVGFTFVPDVLPYFFYSGPFAWNGIFIFWLALTSYTVWLVAMGMLVRRAILEDPNLVSAPVRTMPDRPTAAA
jgi:MFS family permease